MKVIKIFFISGLIVFNVILSAIQKVHHGNHFWTWNKPYGFSSDSLVIHPSHDTDPGIVLRGEQGQFLALWTAICAAVFSYVSKGFPVHKTHITRCSTERGGHRTARYNSFNLSLSNSLGDLLFGMNLC